MADSTTFNQPGATAPAVTKHRPARKETSRARKAGSFTLWAALIAGSILALAPITQFSLHEIDTVTLTRADNASVEAALEQDWPHSMSASKLEALSELSLQMPTPGWRSRQSSTSGPAML